jgi:hypothetical protein
MRLSMDNETIKEISEAAYEAIQQQFKEQSIVLGEAFKLIYEAGLLDNMSMKAREYLSSKQYIQDIIKNNATRSLEPRLSLNEYRKHIIQLMEVPRSQIDFATFIIQVCYIMILAEKNPLIAQELRGVLNINSALKEIIGQ